MAFVQAKTIEKLETDHAEKDHITQVLNDENESARNSKTKANKRADEATRRMEEMRRTHLTLVEEMGHRITIVMAERNGALKELEYFKAKFDEVVKEKDNANKAAQEACEKAVALRDKRDATMLKVQEA